MEYVLEINGYGCFPSKYEVQLSDVDREDGSGRNQNGDMLRDRAGVKKKVILTFAAIPQSKAERLLQAVKDEFVTVTYLDPELGKRTMTAYVGDRNCQIFKYDRASQEWIWDSITFNLIEK